MTAKMGLAIVIFAFSCLAEAGGLCVVETSVPLRKKPSAKAPVVDKLKKFTPLVWTGRRERGYLEVSDFFGKTGWVWGRVVSDSVDCVVIKVKKSRLRNGPGEAFQARAVLANRGQAFKDLGGEDGWTQVVDEKGNKFWVNLEHLWRPQSRLRLSFER